MDEENLKVSFFQAHNQLLAKVFTLATMAS